MPEIVPVVKEGTMIVQANTQMPSAQLQNRTQSQLSPQNQEQQSNQQQNQPTPQPTQTGSEVGEHKAKQANEEKEQVIKQRLAHERMKRQIEAERKRLADEKRHVEAEKAQSRKWFEAEELARQGRVLEAAQKAGISYEQMTQQILNNGQIPPAQVAERTAQEVIDRKFEEYKKHLEAQAKASQQKAYQDSLKQIKAEVRYAIDRSEKYTLAKHSEPYEDITKLIETEYHRTGRIIPVEEAIERWESEALEGLQELLKLENVRTNVLKENSPYQQAERRVEVPNTISQRTMAPVPQPKAMTEAERKQRAIDAFYGRLT